MKRLQGYKYELMPDGEQRRKMGLYAGACRWLWNREHALREEVWLAAKSVGGKPEANALGYVAMASGLKRLKEEEPWLREVPSQCLQQALKNYDRAWVNFFKGIVGKPRFKKKGKSVESFRFPQGFKHDENNSRIFLPKLGWVRYRKSREIEGNIKNVTVSLRCGKWFVSIQTERQLAVEPKEDGSAIGIDRGINKFTALSDGKIVKPLNAHKKSLVSLRHLQRGMSRKVKFSNNWKKQKHKIERKHHRIANQRRDFLHKLSTEISKNHAIVAVEKLGVANMSKSAKGNVEKHGSNVKAKSGLNRSILDQGWHEFSRQLQYKLLWNGGELVEVPAPYTSMRCHKCGHTDKRNRKNLNFRCVRCGHEDDADTNASKNILSLAVGHTVTVCGGLGVSQPRKQKPPEEVLRLVA